MTWVNSQKSLYAKGTVCWPKQFFHCGVGCIRHTSSFTLRCIR